MSSSPIRKALRLESTLQAHVRDGLGAIDRSDRQFLDPAIRERITDSLETDENLRLGREGENRWDYLLGDGSRRRLVALEPHGANEKEMKVVVAKKAAALLHLRPHLREGQHVSAWFWVQSSGAGFLDTAKARREANQNGIIFVGRKLMAKHLDAVP